MLLRRGLIGLAAVVLLLIVLVALLRTEQYIAPLLADFPAPYGAGGILVAGGYALASAALVYVVWRLSGTNLGRTVLLPVSVVLLAVVIRVVVAASMDGAIYGETRIVRDQAVGVLAGDCCFGHRPLGYPIALAGAFGLVGEGPAAIEGLNLAFAALTAWLTWDIGRIAWNRRVGALAGAAYAVAPSQVLLVLVPLTEPMFTVAVAAAVRLAIAGRERALATDAALTAALGATLAVGQYVRSTAVVLLLPVIAHPFLAGWRWPAAIVRGVVVTAVFLVVMLPVASYNLKTHDTISISTSAYGGWSLYLGTDPKYGGKWNAEDAAFLASLPGTTWERSEQAGSAALDRIMKAPGAVVGMLPTKFITMWADESYASGYAFGEGSVTRWIRVGWLTSQLFWVPLVVLAFIGLLLEWRKPNAAALLIGNIVVLVATMHLLLEVHSRYHAYLVPLLCVLGAAGLAGGTRWLSARWPYSGPEGTVADA